MKYRIFYIVLLLAASLSSTAQSLVVKKKDGTSQVIGGNVYFPQDKSSGSWSVSTSDGGVYRASSDISALKSISILDGIDLDLALYKSPTYNDYYLSVAGWEQRSEWNLANIHDPSVMLAEDGYYYMYCTDAGYGNTHEKDVQGNK